jgi:hypothetical protein
MKKIILFIIILAVGIALGIYFQKQSKTQKIETQAQTDADKAGDVVKEGVQKVDAVAADVKSGIQTGVQKSEGIATNVAGQVKEAAQKVGEFTTNAVGEIKQKLN